MTNFDQWLALHSMDRDDPYALDIIEMGVRVADCFETHSTDMRSIREYLDYWFSIARLDAMLK